MRTPPHPSDPLPRESAGRRPETSRDITGREELVVVSIDEGEEEGAEW